MTSIAIVGAGFGGLTAAHLLTDHGARVTILDKGSFPGGRLATRRQRDSPITFDHGAQYFTVTHPTFASLRDHLLSRGVITQWDATLVIIDAPGVLTPSSSHIPRYVGTPHMNAIATHLASDLDVRLRTPITRIIAHHNTFELVASDDQALGPFDALILNLPPAQASPLLDAINTPTLSALCARSRMLPCWALMLELPSSLATFDGAFINVPDSPLSWIAKNSGKPGRHHAPESWVLHATHAWSAAHLEDSPEVVAQLLHDALCELLPHISIPLASRAQAHRWRFAIPQEHDTTSSPTHIDPHLPLALCGDWLGGGRVEGAYLTGINAAKLIVERLGLERRVEAHTESWLTHL